MCKQKSPDEIGLYLPPEVLRLDYSFATRAVLAEILQLSRREGQCSASDAHFVKRLGVSKNTASRAVQQLIDDGVLSVAYNTNGRLTRFLTPAADQPQNGGGEQPQNGGGAPADHPQNGAVTTPKMGGAPPPKWGTNEEGKKEEKAPHPTCAAARRVGGADVSSSALTEPAERRQEGSARALAITLSAAPGKSADALPRPEPFDAFWAVWPRTEKRKDAEAAFRCLSPADQQAAAEYAQRWLQQHPRQVSRGAVPYAANWLRNEQWLDGPEPADRSRPPVVATTARTDASRTLQRQKANDWR